MLLQKKVSDEGEINLTLNGMDLNYELSQFLTGTTSENDDGVFTRGQETFHFGEFSHTFHWETDLDPLLPVEEIAEILQYRIVKVREWVASCKATAGEVEVV